MKNSMRRDPVLMCVGAIALSGWGFIAFVAADEKKVIPDHTGFQSCEACHAEKQSGWEASDHGKAIRLIAKNDPAAKDCGGCHSAQGHEGGGRAATPVSSKKESYHRVACLACHDRKGSEFPRKLIVNPEKLCDVCHTQRSVFLGLGAKGIEESRNFHSGVPCVSCHMTEGNHRMKVLRPDDPGLTEKRLDTCTACHMDNNREARVGQIQEWQTTYDESMTPLLADIKAIEAAMAKKPDILDTRLRSKLEDVKHNLSILEKDGSRGFHNFVFLLEISSMASADLKEIKAAVR